MTLPTIAFDTSAINRLAKDISQSEPLMAALCCGCDTQVTGIVVGELISTRDPALRETLIACCHRLLRSGRCIWPPHEIVRRLVSAHATSPTRFDWRNVGVRARGYERAIIERNFTEDLCAVELEQQLALEDKFLGFWRALGPKLDPFFDANPQQRPTSYHEAVQIARSGETNIVSGIGQALYSAVAGIDLSELDIRIFIDGCPPFRAACLSLCGSWYDCSVRRPAIKRIAGRNDHMMAVYLPYCGRFVTRDAKQEERLREIAIEVQVDCEVLYYENFLASFEVVA
jgi:hypothetical protein